MATKTLILRPVKVTCDDETLVTPTPSDTTIDNWHLLVNEEVRDYGSTCLLCKSPSNVSYYFNYIKPVDMENIIGLNLHIVDKCNNGESTGFSYSMVLTNSYALPNISLATGQSWADIDKIITANQSDNANIFDELNGVSDFYVIQGVSTNGNKAAQVLVTQVYVEIIYEALEPIHIKNDDTWDMVKCKEFYLRNSNAWTKLELPIENIFENNSKYRIKEVD